MTRKGVPIKRQTYEELKKCKTRETERNVHVLKRLLDKYEKELIDNA